MELDRIEELDILTSEDLGWKVLLHNDDVNTFQWVIECLVDICSHDPIQAEQCAWIVHYKGRATVKSGDLGKMQSIATALCDRGLSATVEQNVEVS